MINLFEYFLVELSFCIVFYPFFYSVFVLVFKNKISDFFVEVIVFLSLALSFVFSFSLAYFLNSSTFMVESFFIIDISYYFSWIWFDLGQYPISLSFMFDKANTILLTVITFVAWMVHVYSFGYMKADPRYKHFLGLLLLFTFFMLFFVASDSIVQVFIGWEGVGLCSYLLINFWYQRTQANKSAIKAFVVNKIGDFAFYLVLILVFIFFNTFYLSDIYLIKKSIFSSVQTFDTGFIFKAISIVLFGDMFEQKQFFADLFVITNYSGFFDLLYFSPITLISLFLCIAAMAKSAQFGLHTWLPDAMEGPTPVSALIHSATMVCAGIILLIKFSSFINLAPNILVFITVIGSLTAFFGATVASAQFDIKKIIAYSTCSQIGYMFLACGLSFYGLSLFHLTTHAFFKSLLFLSSGVLIHALSDEQDMRRARHSIGSLPRNYVFFSIGLLSLAGLPFFSGVSKEFIIFAALSTSLTNSTYWLLSIAFFLSLLAAFYTSIYCLNILEYLLPDVYDPYFKMSNSSSDYFFSEYRVRDISFIHLMLVPISILSLLSLFSATFLTDFFINFNNTFFSGSKYYEFNIPYSFRIFLLFLNTIVIFFFIGSESSFFRQKWNYDYFISVFIKQNLIFAYKYVYLGIEKGWLEFFGPSGLWKLIRLVSIYFNSFYSRLTSSYVFIFIFFFYLLLVLFLFYWF